MKSCLVTISLVNDVVIGIKQEPADWNKKTDLELSSLSLSLTTFVTLGLTVNASESQFPYL